MQQNNNIVRGLQLYQRAKQLHEARLLAQAADAFRQAMVLLPSSAELLADYAKLAEEVGDWKAAEQLYRRIGELRPASGFQGKLGLALFRQDRWAEAAAEFTAFLARRPGDEDALLHRGVCLTRLGRWQEAVADLRRAAARGTSETAELRLLACQINLGEADDAEATARRLMTRWPDSGEVRSICAEHWFKAGDYARAWDLFRSRWATSASASAGTHVPCPAWDGQAFDGLLLVSAEQGLGDEIMASSLYGDLVAMGQAALVECDARLTGLLGRAFPSLRFTERNKGALQAACAEPGEKRKIDAADLGAIFRRSRQAFPARNAWLSAEPARVAALREDYRARFGDRLRVGISWRSQRAEFGESKSLSLDTLAPVLQVPGVAFVNLQYGDVAADVAAARERHGVDIFVDPRVDTRNDIEALAAQACALDLVISTSNTTVHVAGSLGVPCQVLLPRAWPLLWYWGYAGSRSPWYPSLELLRNDRDGDWAPFIAGVARRLAAHVQAGRP